MQNQKGSMSVGISFIIVAIIIGLIIYALMKVDKTKADPLEGIGSSKSEEVDQTQSESQQATPTNPNEVAKGESSTNTKTMETNKRLLQNFTPISSVTTLIKKDLVVGTGAEVKAGATVSVHYIGAIASTGEVFQSSKDFGTEPITFPLSGVIKGWTDGIPGMKVGGTRRLIIPSDLAYGAKPDPRSGIPPNADLVFDVELVAVK